ncbi:MAG: PAS domain-containing protein [Proteobacteria bacterium]|nr:PAS domain-containing protein [Pseudomonadota bacterium]MBU4395613.1 PAS domain-containing protein [Pseudomonadota bacterium]MBU4584412.1 PAS domain-containing protein [Pseudomonadota bacterium]
MSEDNWRNTFDAITDLVSVLDKDYFRIVKVNKALAGFLHKKPEELIGKHCYEVMHGKNSHWEITS